MGNMRTGIDIVNPCILQTYFLHNLMKFLMRWSLFPNRQKNTIKILFRTLQNVDSRVFAQNGAAAEA